MSNERVWTTVREVLRKLDQDNPNATEAELMSLLVRELTDMLAPKDRTAVMTIEQVARYFAFLDARWKQERATITTMYTKALCAAFPELDRCVADRVIDSWQDTWDVAAEPEERASVAHLYQ